MTEQHQFTLPLRPAAPSNPFTKELKEDIETALQEWKCPGISISVIDGEEIFSESFGYAVLPSTPATNDTLWCNGSCSTTYTSALLAKLIDSKSACPALAAHGWSTTMASVLRDDFVLPNSWATLHATVEDASHHTTGMGSHELALLRRLTLPDGTTRPTTIRDHVRQMRHLRMGDEPRRRFIYSNHVYMALSYLLETATGQPLCDALREHLWRPLGMTATYLGEEEAAAGTGTLAVKYCWDAEMQRYRQLVASPATRTDGAGAVISTVRDAAKWLRCLITKSEPLSAATHADIRKQRVNVSATPANGRGIMTYGLGWTRTVFRGQVLYRHSVPTNMIRGCEMFWLPDVGFGFVAAGNGVFHLWSGALALKLIADRIGVPMERKDFLASLKMREDSREAGEDTAMETLFLDRGDSPTPSPFSAGDFAGTYHDAGYGTLVFAAEKNPGGGMVLEATRPDAFFPMRIRLVPVTGLHWLAYIDPLGGNTRCSLPSLRAEFKVGVDGKVGALEIDFTMTECKLTLEEGKVLFEKVGA